MPKIPKFAPLLPNPASRLSSLQSFSLKFDNYSAKNDPHTVKLDTIYNKSCQKMSELPDESIDMILTSPPYWSLRDYGEDVKEIWGGDPDCRHDFQSYKRPSGGGHANPEKARAGATKKDIQRIFGAKAAFCNKCGSWRGQLGLEPDFNLYLDHMMIVCAEIRRVLKKTGSFWLNMGDTYGGSGGAGGDYNIGGLREDQTKYKQAKIGYAKCLLGIPWRLVLRLVDEQGWILRNAIIWHKPNAMPSSVKDRCSNNYEFLFHLVKAKRYYYDLDAIRESHKDYCDIIRRVRKAKEYKCSKDKGQFHARSFQNNPEKYANYIPPSGKNPGDVWTIPTQPRPEAHFATFPDALCTKPILATCPQEICKKCGKARVRITERVDKYEGEKKQKADIPHLAIRHGKGRTTLGHTFEGKTIGWTSCSCSAGWNSGVLLDPFAGRGTALIMAKKLGRHYIGYELNRKYCTKLIQPALDDIDPLFQTRKH